jgi:hypothetical protein
MMSEIVYNKYPNTTVQCHSLWVWQVTHETTKRKEVIAHFEDPKFEHEVVAKVKELAEEWIPVFGGCVTAKLIAKTCSVNYTNMELKGGE